MGGCHLEEGGLSTSRTKRGAGGHAVSPPELGWEDWRERCGERRGVPELRGERSPIGPDPTTTTSPPAPRRPRLPLLRALPRLRDPTAGAGGGLCGVTPRLGDTQPLDGHGTPCRPLPASHLAPSPGGWSPPPPAAPAFAQVPASGGGGGLSPAGGTPPAAPNWPRCPGKVEPGPGRGRRGGPGSPWATPPPLHAFPYLTPGAAPPGLQLAAPVTPFRRLGGPMPGPPHCSSSAWGAPNPGGEIPLPRPGPPFPSRGGRRRPPIVAAPGRAARCRRAGRGRARLSLSRPFLSPRGGDFYNRGRPSPWPPSGPFPGCRTPDTGSAAVHLSRPAAADPVSRCLNPPVPGPGRGGGGDRGWKPIPNTPHPTPPPRPATREEPPSSQLPPPAPRGRGWAPGRVARPG